AAPRPRPGAPRLEGRVRAVRWERESRSDPWAEMELRHSFRSFSPSSAEHLGVAICMPRAPLPKLTDILFVWSPPGCMPGVCWRRCAVSLLRRSDPHLEARGVLCPD